MILIGFFPPFMVTAVIVNVITEGVPSGNWGGMTSATWLIEVGHQLQVTCTIVIWNCVTCIWLASRLDSSLVSWFNELSRDRHSSYPQHLHVPGWRPANLLCFHIPGREGAWEGG